MQHRADESSPGPCKSTPLKRIYINAMLKKIVQFGQNQPLFLFLLVLTFIGAGVAAFQNLPIEAFPDVSDVQVTVITLHPGHAPEEVEKQVTIPIETVLAGVPHSVRLFSHTQFGLSYVVATFDDKVNDYFARQQVMEKLSSADLPQGVQPSLAPLSTPVGEIYRFTVNSTEKNSRELRSLEDWVIERNLKMVPGVADVVSFGGLVKQYEVRPDLAKIKLYNISLQQVFTALGRGNNNSGGGYTQRGGQQFLIRGVGLLQSVDDIGEIVVSQQHGTPIRVKEIGEVAINALPRQGVAGQDDNDDIVSGIVLLRNGENPSVVLAKVKERIDELNTRILPKGVKIVSYYDRSWLIGKTLNTVFHNLAEGAILVTLVLVVFLGNVRAALIVTLVIPLSLLAVAIGLTLRGIPANLLSLGSIDFGIIVDGAVIVVENVFRHLSNKHPDWRKDRKGFREVIATAAVEVGRPTFFSMLIIIAAYLPIFTLQRHEGRIFAPMAWTVTSALIGSLTLSLTLVPLLCYFLLRKPIHHGDNAIISFAKRLYEPALDWCLAHGKFVIGFAAVSLIGAITLFARLGTEFLPELDEGTLWVTVTLPPGISVDESVTWCRKIRDTFRTLPEVKSVISKSGRPEDGSDAKSLNQTETFVDLKPANQWRKGATKGQIIEELQQVILKKYPAVEVGISQPIRDNVLESISQIKGQVVVKVFGDDSTKLFTVARQMKTKFAVVPGVATAFIDRDGATPQAIIQIERTEAARYGVNVQDIQDLVETALGGKSSTDFWEGEQHYGIALRLPETQRSLDMLSLLLVDTADGTKITLGQLAKFRLTSGPVNISREGGRKVKAVSIFIRDRDMGSVVADMKVAAAGISLPEGYFLNWSGEFENQERAMARLTVVLPVSVFIIFVLLFNAFSSVKSAALILLNVPFSVVGGVLAIWLRGMPVSVSAAIGFIALFGAAVLSGVVMVSYMDQLADEGMSALEAVRVGALTRLRTDLMTATLAILGLLPMALSTEIGSEVQRPLATVLIGGLLSATPLNLTVLPVIYLLIKGGKTSNAKTALSEVDPFVWTTFRGN